MGIISRFLKRTDLTEEERAKRGLQIGYGQDEKLYKNVKDHLYDGCKTNAQLLKRMLELGQISKGEYNDMIGDAERADGR